MKVLIKLWYLIRKVWFGAFPRTVGLKGWAPSPTSALGAVGALPPAPATWKSPRLIWGNLGNNRYGDCVFAGIAHAIMAVGRFVKHDASFTDSQVVGAYMKWDNGKDTGVYTDQLLSAWQTDEALNTPLAPFGVGGPFVKLDPKNIAQMKAAIAAFGWVGVGSNLQQAQEDQFALGQRWAYVPGSPVVGGHFVVLTGYDKAGVGPYTVTWGRGIRATWGWVTNTCDEAYTGVLPPHLFAERYVVPLRKLDEYCARLPAA